MSTRTIGNGHIQATHAVDRPPVSALLYAVVWWLTRPWLNTIAIAAPVSVLVGGFMLVTYLHAIGHEGLLVAALSPSAGLTAVAVSGLVVVISLVVMVFFGAWFAYFAASFYEPSASLLVGHEPSEPLMPSGMSRLYAAGTLIWIAISVIVVACNAPIWLMAIVGCALAGALAFFGSLIDKNRRWRGASVGALIALAVMALTLAMLPALVLANGSSSNPITWVALVGLPLLSAVAAGVVLRAAAGIEPLPQVMKRVALAMPVMCMVVIMAAGSNLDFKVLQALGVYSTRPAQFVVVNQTVLPGLRAAGITLRPVMDACEPSLATCADGQRNATTERAADGKRAANIASDGKVPAWADAQGREILGVYVRYSFAGRLLLCTKAFDPVDAQKPTGSCVSLLTDDVRRVMVAPEPSRSSVAAIAKGNTPAGVRSW